MYINQTFMDSCSPIELQFMRTCIDKLIYDKVTTETTNYDNLKDTVCECPHCHSKNYKKNGFNPKYRQKYRCKDCGTVFMATTGTFFSHSPAKFLTWVEFVACKLNGETLEQESLAIEKPIHTCFNMRHKLYSAAGKKLKEELSGQVELDAAYTKINLKGTRKKDMPRLSKKRGKHKTSLVSKGLSGISHHKVCIVTAIDEHDNILYKVTGQGSESQATFEQYARYFKKGSTVISDSKPCICNFAEHHSFTSEPIPVVGGRQVFTTSKGNSLGDCNELHTELKNLMRRAHGISTRHLQCYIDWLVFKKQLKYMIELKKRRSTTYMGLMRQPSSINTADICKQKMPIDLYRAYGEYHYGIFSPERLSN